jgi:preprotein translocase subunit YajC
MFEQTCYAMASSQQGSGGEASPVQLLFPMVIVFAIFYLLLIRPQQKEKRKLQEVLDSLKPGDKIVTTGGILGTVHSLSDQTVQLKLADNVKITVLRSAIRGLHDASTGS